MFKLTMKGIRFKKYYYRVIGFALFGAGFGLVCDEILHGPFTLTPNNHEFWGLVMLVVGTIFISRKPHGK